MRSQEFPFIGGPASFLGSLTRKSWHFIELNEDAPSGPMQRNAGGAPSFLFSPALFSSQESLQLVSPLQLLMDPPWMSLCSR